MRKSSFPDRANDHWNVLPEVAACGVPRTFHNKKKVIKTILRDET